jgi:hypothetical protein
MFTKPIQKGEEGRCYTVEYDLEEPERYFANAFLIDCNELILIIEYPDDPAIGEPVLYNINQETEEQTVSDLKPKIEKIESGTRLTWKQEDITKGDTFKLTW